MIVIALREDERMAAGLFPFTLTRPVSTLRCGILTLREKWAARFAMADDGLASRAAPSGQLQVIPANVLPTPELVDALAGGDAAGIAKALAAAPAIATPADLLRFNPAEMRADFALLTSGRNSQELSTTNQQTGAESIFIERGAQVEFALLNAGEGPIYIGPDATIMEGALIRGPFALGEGSLLKMGTKIYGATSIGPHCVVGGEIKNTILAGFSNKAHDGYLGDAVVGMWCNLGGGTTSSNMKNNAGSVSLWNPLLQLDVEAGMKCGLMMGDFSRSAINTSFNTGTVVGVCANVFGLGLTPRYIPSFSWGFTPAASYDFDKAIRDLRRWMAFKNKSPEDELINQLKSIFELQNQTA